MIRKFSKKVDKFYKLRSYIFQCSFDLAVCPEGEYIYSVVSRDRRLDFLRRFYRPPNQEFLVYLWCSFRHETLGEISTNIKHLMQKNKNYY